LTVILTQKVGSGRARCCNSTCHAARETKCRCICGGRYHGVAVGKEGGPRSVEEAEAMRPQPKEAILE
jgi:hypothetical protein